MAILSKDSFFVAWESARVAADAVFEAHRVGDLPAFERATISFNEAMKSALRKLPVHPLPLRGASARRRKP